MTEHGGKLIVCPTPIGNLGDASPRVIETLSKAEIVACEDTRVIGKLFELLGIQRVGKFVPYHDHNAQEQVGKLIQILERGTDVVLVSDAGTPTISDPGYRLVREASHHGFEVESIPGPCAAIVALAGSGLPTDQFAFVGFLPKKKSERSERLETASALGTIVAYESARRVPALLTDARDVFPDETEVVVARELTKKFETFYRGTLQSLSDELNDLKGECVVVFCVERGSVADVDAQKLALALKAEGVSPSSIKRVVKDHYKIPKSEIHDWITDK